MTIATRRVDFHISWKADFASGPRLAGDVWFSIVLFRYVDLACTSLYICEAHISKNVWNSLKLLFQNGSSTSLFGFSRTREKGSRLIFPLYGKWNISTESAHDIDTIECNANSHDAIYSWFHAVRADIDRKLVVKYSFARPSLHTSSTLRRDARPRNKHAVTYTRMFPVYTNNGETVIITLSNPLYTNLVILNQRCVAPLIPKPVRFEKLIVQHSKSNKLQTKLLKCEWCNDASKQRIL